MDELKIFNKLKKIPVFTLNDFKKVVRTTYAKSALSHLVKKKIVFHIIKGRYTVYDDPFIIAPFIYKSSYIGSYSALYYHGLITQIPMNIICITGSPPKKIKVFDREIRYRHSKYIFGYEMIDYKGLKIPISSPEKAIIDSIGLVPLHVILEEINNINKDKLWLMAQRMPPPIKRRIAYIIFKTWGEVINIPTGRRIYLDPVGQKKGKFIKQFNIIDNVIL
ncbi:hypothetical protein J7J90_01075 [Candidatus Micrarchaeota archaeon]|nr:hypothetical protein [Candidatus Micrarchaeota archaeon]